MGAKFKPSLTLKKFAAENSTKVVDGETVVLDDDQIKSDYEAFVALEKETFEEDAIEADDDEDDSDFNNKEAVSDMSFPPSPRADRNTKILRGKWRDQGRIKCGQPKCCYPLNPTMIKGERQKMAVPVGHEGEGDLAYKASCSWDPRHSRPEDGSDQYVTHNQLFPPDDPADEDLD